MRLWRSNGLVKKSCPVKAINMDENDIATIDPAKCVNCGACVAGCPFGAISDVSMMTNVIEALKDGKKEVVALIAPAIEGRSAATPFRRSRRLSGS